VIDPARARLRLEAARVDLRWACEDCAHFAPEAAACAHRYPVTTHRRGAMELAEGRAEDLFCKEFELA
jgi:hypothetical protein